VTSTVSIGKGVFKPTGPGILRFTMSNSFSILRAKTVYLRVLGGVDEVEARIRSRSPYSTSDLCPEKKEHAKSEEDSESEDEDVDD
jgi:hypothetical protein